MMPVDSGERPGHRLVRFAVTGRVQRVGFRWFVREQARALGLPGRVWNESDGSVSLMVSGSEESLQRLERALARGPDGSRVDSVTRVSASDGGRSGLAAGAQEPMSTPPLPYPFAIDR